MQLLRRLSLAIILLPVFMALNIITLLQMSASMVFGTGRRGWRIAVAYDQLGNTSVGGHEDETFSSRCWRMRHVRRYQIAMRLIDWVFLKLEKEPDHCKASYEKEQDACSNRFS